MNITVQWPKLQWLHDTHKIHLQYSARLLSALEVTTFVPPDNITLLTWGRDLYRYTIIIICASTTIGWCYSLLDIPVGKFPGYLMLQTPLHKGEGKEVVRAQAWIPFLYGCLLIASISCLSTLSARSVCPQLPRGVEPYVAQVTRVALTFGGSLCISWIKL